MELALNDRQKKVIELYATGETVTNIAKICGVSRQTIYTDLNSADVKAGVDNCLTEMKTQAEKKLSKDADLFVEEIKRLALTSKSDKVRSENLQYLLNRIYGTPTSKVADVTEEENKKEEFDLELLTDIEEDNVINITNKKKVK